MRRTAITLGAAAAGMVVSMFGVTTASAAEQAPPSVSERAEAQAQASPKGESTTAADGCWTAEGRWWCSNVEGAPVYNGSWEPVGYMNTNPSWFECRLEAGEHGGGGPHPNRWVQTTADNGEFGFMKDSDIESETNPLPAC